MPFIHDVIKRIYTYQGYLPNYPYHLISDKEMFSAFINYSTSSLQDSGTWFGANYPYAFIEDSDRLMEAYATLRDYIVTTINDYLQNPDSMIVPDWIYSYMVGSTVSPKSDSKDIHDLLVLLGVDNMDDVFTAKAAEKCYEVSESWINKLPSIEGETKRPLTMFGEPHIIKSLRLNSIY